MKTLATALMLLTSSLVFAQDMSRTETYEEAYREMPDGSTLYVGGCSTHQDYEKMAFEVTQVLVPYFEPSDYESHEINQLLKPVPSKLLAQVLIDSQLSDLECDSFSCADDMTVETLKSTQIMGLDLIRFNIGVGGGNGMYLVYNKTRAGYKLVSNTFDGDLLFCDKKVWLK
jgi:hypothetical protein